MLWRLEWWPSSRPWSSGEEGPVGTSHGGATQHAIAIANAPALAAMVLVDAMSNTGYYGIRHHGAFELRWLNWVFTLRNATGPRAGAGVLSRTSSSATRTSRPGTSRVVRLVGDPGG